MIRKTTKDGKIIKTKINWKNNFKQNKRQLKEWVPNLKDENKLKGDEIAKAYKFYKLFKIKIYNNKERDQIWRFDKLKGCSKFLRCWCENLDTKREKKKKKNGYLCQTTRNLETCATPSRRGCQDLLNFASEGGFWWSNNPTTSPKHYLVYFNNI